MSAPENFGPETDDVLTLGESRSPRWGLLGAVIAVLLLGLGAYQLVSGLSAPSEPPPAADVDGARGPRRAAPLQCGQSGIEEGRAAGPTVRVAGQRMTLRGPAVTQAHRETAAVVVGPLGHSWMIKLTSTACEGPTDAQVLYGVADTTGRFKVWHAGSRRPASAWYDSRRHMRLVQNGSGLEVRWTSTGRVLARYSTEG